MTPLAKYIWLIKLLQGTDGMTFEDINDKWLSDCRDTEDENMPILKRTFHNHIKTIREDYGINIECGRGYKYFIADPDREVSPKVELLSLLNMLSETATNNTLNKSMYVEDFYDLFRNKKVITIMDAIKTKHKVLLANFRRKNKPDKFQKLNVAPYQLHYICSNWYLIGMTDEFGLMRIPLAYYLHIEKKDASYKYPAQYSAAEYNKMIYGTTSETINLTIKIKSYNPQEYHLSEYPLMPFQKELLYKERLKEEDTVTFVMKNHVNVNLELPKTPFTLYTLKKRLEKYRYQILNDMDPFALFNEEQYKDDMDKPIVL